MQTEEPPYTWKKQQKGTACLSPEQRRELGRMGGLARHQEGCAPTYMELHPDEARIWARKGGLASFGADPERARAAGRKSGEVRRQQRQRRRSHALRTH